MTLAAGGLVLGYDFGTSAVKAALFRRDGSVVARANVAYPLSLPAPGWAEQDPSHWWAAMRDVTARVLGAANVDTGEIEAIGICAQMCGVVLVDKSGSALGKCLIWLDTRSGALARRVFGGWPNVAGYSLPNLIRWLRLTGGAPNLQGKDATSKILWLRAEDASAWEQAEKILDVKDYLVRRCTDRSVTSFDCAHLTWVFDSRAGKKHWSKVLMDRLGLKESLFPRVASATDVAGKLTPVAAFELGLAPGIPVAVGLGDVSAAALSSGAIDDGAPHLCVGTSAWLGAHIPKSKVSPLTGIGSICRADGIGYFLIAPQESAGACIKWATEALGFGRDGFAEFERSAAEANPSIEAPLFMPWLYGERVPIQDENIRGGFLNISIAHTRADMAHAVYEGVALNMRWAMTEFDRLGACAGKPLRLVGGGGGSAVWCQIFADVLQRPVELMEDSDLGGAKGSAMAASVAAGWYSDLATASAMTKVARVFAPDPTLASLYAARFARFTKAYKRVRAWYRPTAIPADKGSA
jgi:xylulokinase